MNNHTPDIPTKQCVRCGVEYPPTTEFFYSAPRNNDSLHSWCKQCHAKRMSEIRKSKADYADQLIPEGAVKVCTKCGAKYPATTEFWHRNNGGKYGLSPRCKRCESARKKVFRQQNYEHCRILTHQSYIRNREQKREYSKMYYMAHRDALLEGGSIWQKNNLDKVRAKGHRYRARIRNSEGSFSADDLNEQFRRQKGKCYWCGKKLDKDNYHADHVIPLIKGGSNYISNIVCACAICNCSKSGKLPHEWDGNGGKLL